MPYSVDFFVVGRPEPKGSFRALMIHGRPTAVPDNSKSRAWERLVRLAASAHAPERELDEPVNVWLYFYLERPGKPTFPDWPAAKPDIDKLTRSTLDALSKTILRDDARIVRLLATKDYGTPQGCQIRVQAARAQEELFR